MDWSGTLSALDAAGLDGVRADRRGGISDQQYESDAPSSDQSQVDCI